MRAIQMTEFGGPEVLRARRAAAARARARARSLIRVTRAGLNFADTHTRTNSYVQKATLPLVPGGEVAGVREDTGERVVALVGHRRLRRVRDRARASAIFPIPDGIDDGTALALLDPGHDRLAPATAPPARVAAGESVVVHSAAGGVGSLAVAARPPRSAPGA